jgi:hypothetical protein
MTTQFPDIFEPLSADDPARLAPFSFVWTRDGFAACTPDPRHAFIKFPPRAERPPFVDGRDELPA